MASRFMAGGMSQGALAGLALAAALAGMQPAHAQQVDIATVYTYRPQPGDRWVYRTRNTYPNGFVEEGTWTSDVTAQTRRVGVCDYYVTRVRAVIGSAVQELESEVAIDPFCGGGWQEAAPNTCTEEWAAPSDIPRTVTLGTGYAYDDTLTRRCFFAPSTVVERHVGEATFTRDDITVAAGSFANALRLGGSETAHVSGVALSATYAAWYAPDLPPLYNDQSFRQGDGPWTRNEIELVAFSRASAPPAGTRVGAVEYYHAGFDHYFLTASAAEIAALDGGQFQGWARTGLGFDVFAAGDAPAGTASVCRFFSESFAPKSSHFYTPLDAECEDVKTLPAWTFEGVVFAVQLPQPDGTCPAGTTPVFRLYNSGQSGAPNHRYTADAGVRAQLLERGWIPEGYGADGVIMCAPA